jgi:hypothetical protein
MACSRPSAASIAAAGDLIRNAELDALQQARPEITAAGASLVVVSPQVARARRETEESTPMTCEVLRDLGNRRLPIPAS